MGNRGPLVAYQVCLDAGEIQPDAAQESAVRELQRLYVDLERTGAGTGQSWLARLLRRPAPAPTVQGLYLWGGVGRGKTFLMDLFFETLPGTRKLRLHFHRFMRRVHRELVALQGTPNPLKAVADSFAADADVICFDEFFVSDITDAMILGGLLDALFAHGVVLVATSNIPPDGLYKDGLQRSKFLPAIDLLNRRTNVLNVDGNVDYRLRALESAALYHQPLSTEAEANLALSFRQLAPDAGEEGVSLEIEGREIASKWCADGVVWFDFGAVCDGPRSQNDYIELARLFQTVLISNVPVLGVDIDDQARRFISLIDEFYDRNVKLVLSAAVPIEDLYTGARLSFEFERTMSRLREMQSHDYLARQHLA